MTRVLTGEELAETLRRHLPDAILEQKGDSVLVKAESLYEVAQLLKETPGLEFGFLNSITGVDFVSYFEVVYHVTSLERNHMAVIKTRCYDRESPALPSVVSLWQGADLQEREVWDLMGIRFEGHPNLKRIMLWEGFQGHPLRKDFVETPNPQAEASQ